MPRRESLTKPELRAAYLGEDLRAALNGRLTLCVLLKEGWRPQHLSGPVISPGWRTAFWVGWAPGWWPPKKWQDFSACCDQEVAAPVKGKANRGAVKESKHCQLGLTGPWTLIDCSLGQTHCWDMNSVLKYSQATSYLEHSKRLRCQQACPAAWQFWSFFSSQTTRLPVALAPLWISEPHRSTQQSKVQELCEAVCPQIAKIDTSQSVPRAFMINQRTCRPAVIMSTMSSALFWKQSVEEKRR